MRFLHQMDKVNAYRRGSGRPSNHLCARFTSKSVEWILIKFDILKLQ
jgi:hypothetical protein